MKTANIHTEFKREAGRNYMVLLAEEEAGSRYTVQMLDKNPISGLLPFHEKIVDGRREYYYDITSRQPVTRILEMRAATGAEIAEVIAGLIFVLRQLERFLLDEDQLCLNPEYIYVDPDSFQCFLCLIPGRLRAFPDSFQELSQYLLDHVSHNDGGAVVLAFGVFRQSRKENFGVEDIERELKKYREEKGKEAKLSAVTAGEGKEDGKASTERPGAASGMRVQEREERKPPDIWNPAGDRHRKGGPERQGEERKTDELRSNGEMRTKKDWRPILLFPVLLLPLAAVVLFFGMDGIRRFWYVIVGFEAVAAGLWFYLQGGKRNFPAWEAADEDQMGEDAKREEYEILFREEEAAGAEYTPVKRGKKMEEEDDWLQRPRELEPEAEAPGDREDEEFHTVLLTAKPIDMSPHKLIAEPDGEEIYIRYFPFLIGKNRTICDYCLEAQGVSRLHCKLEEGESGCTVTDLNSMNGTYVNGRMLETNETCPLQCGDEIGIAGRKYRFV